MNKFKITIDGKDYEVIVNETEHNMATVDVNGTSYQVHYENESATLPPISHKSTSHAASAPAQVSVPQPAKGGASSIKAPLPGTITTINVKTGEQVKRGDVLIVMEAMKMENNIMANKDGQIKAIHVTAGQTVALDEALIDLE